VGLLSFLGQNPLSLYRSVILRNEGSSNLSFRNMDSSFAPQSGFSSSFG
jgi:hypothetical protein